MDIDFNDLAREIALAERGKREVDITQIKEILSIVFEFLNGYCDEDIVNIVREYQAR